MRNARWTATLTAGSILATCLILVACSDQPRAAGVDVARGPAVPKQSTLERAAVTAPSASLPPALTANASYAAARASLLKQEWLPLRTPACHTNVGGDAPICNTLPETDSCSGDGHCVMHFANPSSNEVLTVQAYGDAEHWNALGREGEFAVTSWSMQKSKAPAGGPCPSQQFDGFLKAFASSSASRRAFTAPIIRVSEFESLEGGDRVVTVAYTAADYDRFNVVFEGGAFHHIDAAGHVDPAPLPIDVRPDNQGGQTARYAYGMSEGRAFQFDQVGSCWRLAAELPPPLD